MHDIRGPGPRILLDKSVRFYYSDTMLDGVRIFSSDAIWRQILTDLGATVVDGPDGTGIDFDSLGLDMPTSVPALRAAIQRAADDDIRIIRDIFGRNVHLPMIQARIVILLYKSGGMSGADLRAALGYAPDATTHSVDTAIYQLRRTFGRNFIQNDNGVYRIGQL